jgi:hypothetical protein
MLQHFLLVAFNGVGNITPIIMIMIIIIIMFKKKREAKKIKLGALKNQFI